MPALIIELPDQQAQTDFNLRRWEEVLADPELAKWDWRVETDRHGQVIMSPPPAPRHGAYQAEVAHLLRTLRPNGRVLTECPISTADGVKAADVAWASPECVRNLGNRLCFPKAPATCVEVLSPRNSEAEMTEKMALYFDAGAQEVWLCNEAGHMTFFSRASSQLLPNSQLCPEFPKLVELH